MAVRHTASGRPLRCPVPWSPSTPTDPRLVPRSPDHPVPEGLSLLNGQAVGPGYHGHHVHSPAEPLQELKVQGPQAAQVGHDGGEGMMSRCQPTPTPGSLPPPPTGSATSPVPSGRHKVYAAVHSRVRDVPLAGDEDLLLQVPLVLLIDVAQDGVPAGAGDGPASETCWEHPPPPLRSSGCSALTGLPCTQVQSVYCTKATRHEAE